MAVVTGLDHPFAAVAADDLAARHGKRASSSMADIANLTDFIYKRPAL